MNCPTLEVPVHERPASESDDAPRCWMVRNGNAVVGPVTLTLIERGLAAGRIPAEAEVSHVDRQSWMPVQTLFVDGPHGTSGIRSVPQPPSIPPAPPVPALASSKTLASPKLVPSIPDDPKPAPAAPAPTALAPTARATVKIDHSDAIDDPDSLVDPDSLIDTVPSARAVRTSEKMAAEVRAEVAEWHQLQQQPQMQQPQMQQPQMQQPQMQLAQPAAHAQPMAVAQPSQPFAEEPVSIPKQGFWESLFG